MTAAGQGSPVPSATTGVVLVNPWSGRGPSPLEEVQAAFDGHRVVECPADELEATAAKILDDDPPFVGMAGGDGSIRSVASLLAGTGVAMVPVPTGTRNHFARELGIDTVAAAAAAAAAGERRAVDLAEVNGERFVNNSSIGFYASLVRERDEHERRWPAAVANVAAAWAQARKGHRFRVEVDGRPHRAWLVFLGNGCYGEGLSDLIHRDRLDAGVLDVRVLQADAPLARTRTVTALLLGQLARSPLLVQREAGEAVVDMDRPSVEVALDGEVVTLRPPLRYRALPGALTVLVPPAP